MPGDELWRSATNYVLEPVLTQETVVHAIPPEPAEVWTELQSSSDEEQLAPEPVVPAPEPEPAVPEPETLETFVERFLLSRDLLHQRPVINYAQARSLLIPFANDGTPGTRRWPWAPVHPWAPVQGVEALNRVYRHRIYTGNRPAPGRYSDSDSDSDLDGPPGLVSSDTESDGTVSYSDESSAADGPPTEPFIADSSDAEDVD